MDLTAGELVTMNCKTTKQGRPPSAGISWYRNNTLLNGTTGEYLFFKKEIEKKDAGSYKCVAKNVAGEAESEVIKITVNEKRGPGGEDNGRIHICAHQFENGVYEVGLVTNYVMV